MSLDYDTAAAEFKCLLEDLHGAGLETQVGPGHDQSLLVLVRVPKGLLDATVYKSRVKDWLWAITPTQPTKGDGHDELPGAFEAEHILSAYHLVNWPKDLGGAGITPGHGRWANVRSVFPLHNQGANRALLVHLSRRLLLRNEDLDRIRDLFGAKVAFYFAFMQTYFLFLVFPAVTGVLAWLLLPKYSLAHAALTLLGCTVFLEYWRLQQADLGMRWNVRGVGALKVNRPRFRYERVVVDAAGRTRHHFPKWKSILRQLLQVPFFAVALCVLGSIIALVFTVETLISEAYQGPYKSILVGTEEPTCGFFFFFFFFSPSSLRFHRLFLTRWQEYLPTVMLAVCLPYINTFLEDVAESLAEFENHRTQDNFDVSLTQKRFILAFIANYLPILLTAFVYIPLGDSKETLMISAPPWIY